MAKAMTLRLTDEQAQALEALAAVEGKDRVDLIRRAIDEMIVRVRDDEEFQARRRQALERHQALLDRLARSNAKATV
jgi:predicted DNA-binding protein